ncbi:NUDIX domain-containing protein [Evansella halocellulosilytica]|uniref:NUDIX domain-containing protein n=1 Tax=Evansella halocellulosilytica TaxID=2011013 RepID=UPI0015C77C6D|nr:NUDIX domain-containing protein [Evansella halocellulosilytica]
MAGFTYETRKAVYAVILNRERDRFLTVQNEQEHYFLPGGGIKSDESHKECLHRELLEETGYEIKVNGLLGEASRTFITSKNQPIINDASFYSAALITKIKEPLEADKYCVINSI